MAHVIDPTAYETVGETPSSTLGDAEERLVVESVGDAEERGLDLLEGAAALAVERGI